MAGALNSAELLAFKVWPSVSGRVGGVFGCPRHGLNQNVEDIMICRSEDVEQLGWKVQLFDITLSTCRFGPARQVYMNDGLGGALSYRGKVTDT